MHHVSGSFKPTRFTNLIQARVTALGNVGLPSGLEKTRASPEPWSSARDFDKVMISLPIPQFDGSSKLHMALTRAAAQAEKVAAAVDLKEGMHFVTARQKIRALREDSVAQKIDKLVAELIENRLTRR